mgnify:CR=1 FL=1
MTIPSGQPVEVWGRWLIREVVAPERLVVISSFSNKDGEVSTHPMAPTWPEFMKVAAVLEDAGEGCTTYHLSWQPHESDEAGHAAFDGAREGMQAGFAGTFAKLDAYLKRLQSL